MSAGIHARESRIPTLVRLLASVIMSVRVSAMVSVMLSVIARTREWANG